MEISNVNSKLYQKTLEWLLARPRSIAETRIYLSRKKSEEDKEEIINQLISRNYLNDTDFAKFYAQNRRINRGISHRRLELELKQKGIPDSIITQALTESPRDDQAEITKIIAKKRAKYDDQQLIAYLVRQGFDYESAKTAVQQTDSRNSE